MQTQLCMLSIAAFELAISLVVCQQVLWQLATCLCCLDCSRQVCALSDAL